MQKAAVLRDNKGFASLLLLVLGVAFFLISGVIVVTIQSESDQQVNLARSTTGETRLVFIAQTMQADYFNNLLQSEFEVGVGTVIMTEGPFIIDPESSFRESMGSQLESALTTSASQITQGDASDVYSEAYSKLPSIGCEAMETSGAGAIVSLRETEDKALELASWSLGQRIFCEDSEAESNVEIDLRARGYRLQTRALLMYKKAVETINVTRDLLGQTTSVYMVTSGWRLPDDVSVKSDVLRSWINDVGIVAATVPTVIEEDDGIYLEPGSVGISKSGEGFPFTESDIEAGCYGEVRSSPEGGPQTCRPDDLTLQIGSEAPEDATNVVDLEFDTSTQTDDTVTAKVKKAGITYTISIPGLGKILSQFLTKVFEGSLDQGYMTYGSTTHLCKMFRGRANSAVISGRIVETNPDYLPGGVQQITMDFQSTAQEIGTSDFDSGVSCSDPAYEEVIRANVFAILTDGGTQEFQLNIVQSQEEEEGEEGEEEDGEDEEDGEEEVATGAQVKQSDLDELAERIAGNDLYNVPGETKSVVLIASVEGGISTTATADPPASSSDSTIQATLDILNTGSSSSSGTGGTTFERLGSSGSPEETILDALIGLDEVGDALTKDGQTDDAEAIAKASTALCKTIGMENWADLGDLENSLLALCGIARLGDAQDAKDICNVAALIQIQQDGSLQGMVAGINGLLRNAGVEGTIDASMIQAAMGEGDIEAILAAAASGLNTQGDNEAAKIIASAGQLIAGLEAGDTSAALTASLGMIDGEAAGVLNAIAGLDTALDSGDTDALLNSISQLTASLGYSGSAELSGITSALNNVVGMTTNFQEALDVCKGEIQWDWLCSLESIGSLVCGDLGACTFDTALPAFDVELFCNQLISDLGFRIDCTCMYTCAQAPYFAIDTVSWGLNLQQLLMTLNPEQYELIVGALDIAELLKSGQIMDYCALDP